MKFIAILISILIIGGYSFVIFKFSGELRKAISHINNKLFQALYIFCLLLPGILLFILLKDEKFIYFWDYSGYWYKAISFTNDFFNSPFQALKSVYQSVKHEEYNSLPNVLLAPANYLLGLNFNSYVFSIYIIYLIPFTLVFSSLVIKLQPKTNNNFKLALPFFILCFAPCLIPMRYGFLDIVGLVYIALILSLLIRSNYFREIKIKYAIFSGLLLLILIFNRRWYAFWFVAFFFSVFIINLIIALKNKNYKLLLNTCINLGIAGIIPVAIMLSFFYPYFEMTVLKDYKDIYSAYRGVGLLRQANGFINFFGLFIILLALIGLILSFKKQKSLTGFFIINSAIIIVLFLRVNDFGGLQHYYLLIPFILIFFLLETSYLSKQKYIPVLLFTLLLANSYFVFIINSPETNNYMFSKAEGKPFFRPDYNEIENIANQVIQIQNQGNYVYCLASGGVLNNDIIKNIKLPDLSSPIFKLQQTQHVDKRDIFPNGLFMADYIITTLPTELHLGAENQKVIAYFNEGIMKGSLKQHYKKIKEFKLNNNVTAYLMQKTSALSNSEIQKIHDYFKDAYPEYEQMYSINRIIAKASDISVGDGYGLVFL